MTVTQLQGRPWCVYPCISFQNMEKIARLVCLSVESREIFWEVEKSSGSSEKARNLMESFLFFKSAIAISSTMTFWVAIVEFHF